MEKVDRIISLVTHRPALCEPILGFLEVAESLGSAASTRESFDTARMEKQLEDAGDRVTAKKVGAGCPGHRGASRLPSLQGFRARARFAPVVPDGKPQLSLRLALGRDVAIRPDLRTPRRHPARGCCRLPFDSQDLEGCFAGFAAGLATPTAPGRQCRDVGAGLSHALPDPDSSRPAA
jgi:hypothetical protein